MSDVRCAIRSHAFSTGVDLIGVVWSDASVSGSYQFIVNKKGSSGSSHVVQRGLVSLQKDEPKIVGTISINAASGDHYVVRLTVTAEGEDIVCSADLDAQSARDQLS